MILNIIFLIALCPYYLAIRVGSDVWPHETARFGPQVGQYDIVAQAYDLQQPPNCTDEYNCDLGCNNTMLSALPIRGKVVFIQRGVCLFIEKVYNAQKLGAKGVVVADNTDQPFPIPMNGAPEKIANKPITIPAVFVRKVDYIQIKAELSTNTTVVLNQEGELESQLLNWSKFLYILPVLGLSICLTTVAYRQLKHRVASYRRNNGVNRIPRVKYGEVEIHNDSCCVCLTDFENAETVSVLPCGHGYHQPCIDTWISDHSDLCPMCKRSILLEPIHEAGRQPTCIERNCKCCFGQNNPGDTQNLLHSPRRNQINDTIQSNNEEVPV